MDMDSGSSGGGILGNQENGVVATLSKLLNCPYCLTYWLILGIVLVLAFVAAKRMKVL